MNALEKLKKLRKEGYTIEELVKIADVSYKSMHDWLHDKVTISRAMESHITLHLKEWEGQDD